MAYLILVSGFSSGDFVVACLPQSSRYDLRKLLDDRELSSRIGEMASEYG